MIVRAECPRCRLRNFDVVDIGDKAVEIAIKCPRCKEIVRLLLDKNTLLAGGSHKTTPPGKKYSVKEKIMHAAIDLFAKQGFKETTAKDIADEVGIKVSVVNGMFNTKSDIMDAILEYYRKVVSGHAPLAKSLERLTADATTEDVLACLHTYLPKDDEVNYIKVLHLMFQESPRNHGLREFFAENMITWQEGYVADILSRLVKAGALSDDINIDFWSRLHVNTTYASAGRLVLGVGENYQNFQGLGTKDMLRTIYDTIFSLYGRQGETPALQPAH